MDINGDQRIESPSVALRRASDRRQRAAARLESRSERSISYVDSPSGSNADERYYDHGGSKLACDITATVKERNDAIKLCREYRKKLTEAREKLQMSNSEVDELRATIAESEGVNYSLLIHRDETITMLTEKLADEERKRLRIKETAKIMSNKAREGTAMQLDLEKRLHAAHKESALLTIDLKAVTVELSKLRVEVGCGAGGTGAMRREMEQAKRELLEEREKSANLSQELNAMDKLYSQLLLEHRQLQQSDLVLLNSGVIRGDALQLEQRQGSGFSDSSSIQAPAVHHTERHHLSQWMEHDHHDHATDDESIVISVVNVEDLDQLQLGVTPQSSLPKIETEEHTAAPMLPIQEQPSVADGNALLAAGEPPASSLDEGDSTLIDLLLKGVPVMKKGGRWGKPHPKTLWLSPDLKSVCYTDRGAKYTSAKPTAWLQTDGLVCTEGKGKNLVILVASVASGRQTLEVEVESQVKRSEVINAFDALRSQLKGEGGVALHNGASAKEEGQKF